jgi:hypothetical protein
MSIPIDLAQITWSGGGVSRFDVRGHKSAQALLDSDETAALQINQKVLFGHNAQRKEASAILSFEMNIVTGTPPKPTGISGNFELLFTFSIGNLDELLAQDESAQEIRLHPQLALMLTSVAYSTARGILYTRLAGTPLDGITLPLIDPRQLLQGTGPQPLEKAKPKARKKPTS